MALPVKNIFSKIFIYCMFITILHTYADTNRCNYNVDILWTAEVAHAPFASSPLVADANADGQLDIISAAFTGEVTVIDGEDGLVLENSKWPVHLQDTSVHASPLQYDINFDGMLDIMITTSDGQFLFYRHDGIEIPLKTFTLGPAYIYKNWYKHDTTVKRDNIGKYLLESSDFENPDDFLPVDPHVLATPVVVDLNQDGRLEEMVVPVSFYFNKEDYRDPEQYEEKLGLQTVEELDNYVVGAIVIVNLTDGSTIQTIHLELSKASSESPAYVLFTPTIIDLDSSGGDLEIVVGTSAGQLHVLNIQGTERQGFPRTMGPIHGQVTVADVRSEGHLHIIAIDTSGTIRCIDTTGATIWEAKISGTSSAGSQIANVNNDAHLDVVVATNDGKLWSIDAVTGQILTGFPLSVGSPVAGMPLVTRVREDARPNTALDMVVLGDNGQLTFLSGDTKCKKSFNLKERSLVAIQAVDLVKDVYGQELLVFTMDGAIMCMRTSNKRDPLEEEEGYVNDVSHVRSHNDFTYTDGKVGLYCTDFKHEMSHISGTYFPVAFEIRDSLASRTSAPYKVKIYMGRLLLAEAVYETTGHYTLDVPTPDRPVAGDISVIMTNKHGQVFVDSFAIGLNLVILRDLQWILTFPFVATASILLILYGYPSIDLLPTITSNRSR
ncbi:unnamed protein product [Owenia fusiformis]|uniref:DEX1 C-terminal domain-containing protein n=1 Tax=Owenia fusiformis TaxID=6347 RepID=A0A8S4PDJ2_OWEFU|nr:unnamed protein product [Owenia fusiformis]